MADPVDQERALLLGVLARLLSEVPEEGLLRRLAALPGDARGDAPLARATAALARAAEAALRPDAPSLEREFFHLFIGVGRGELLPYASYYLTGFLHERPLAELRGDLARLGIARAKEVVEPEDHIATVLEIYAALLDGSLGAQGGGGGGGAQAADRFFADLEGAEAARFYKAVGALGRVAIEIEQAATELPG